MPSSPESVSPFPLPELERDTPPAAREEFVEQVEFAEVEQRPPTPTADEAYQAGLAEGERSGQAAAMKELGPVLKQLEGLVRGLTHVREQRIEEAQHELLEIATDMTRRILHGELSLETDVVVRLARACLQEAKEEGLRVLHVNPADSELLRTHLPDQETDASENELRIEPDPRIPSGGVVLETPRACYDGRPDRILAAVSHQLESTEERGE